MNKPSRTFLIINNYSIFNHFLTGFFSNTTCLGISSDVIYRFVISLTIEVSKDQE